ncbi:MAG: glycosyltransferase [Bacteroidota bacterium]|nr:glycosyltransferase [Bacteroidota bacterium]
MLSLGEREESFAQDGVRYEVIERRSANLAKSLPNFWGYNGQLCMQAVSVWLACDLYSLPLAARASRKTASVLLFDSREYYPYIASLTDRPFRRWFWRGVEWKYGRGAGAVFTVNHSIAERLRARYPGKPVVVVGNYPDADEIVPDQNFRRRLHIPSGHILLLSQGGVQRGRGGALSVRALRRLENCTLVFLGSGNEESRLRSLAERCGVQDRVRFHPAVPSKELLSLTAAADIGLCIIEHVGESYSLALPNKLFEYFAAGLPVIASDGPEIARVVRETSAGLLIRPDDEEGFIAACKSLIENETLRAAFAARAREASYRFRWKSEGERLLNVVREAVDSLTAR